MYFFKWMTAFNPLWYLEYIGMCYKDVTDLFQNVKFYNMPKNTPLQLFIYMVKTESA